MPEYFSEDIIDGKLIDISEREGNWFKKVGQSIQTAVVNIFNQPAKAVQQQVVNPVVNPVVNTFNDTGRNLREATEAAARAAAAAEQAKRDAEARAAAIAAERARNEETKKTLANTYDQTMVQYQQLVSKGQYLQVQISEYRYKIIPQLNTEIKSLTDENTRLRNKEKSLDDNTTFFKNIVSGRNGKDGYKQKIVKNQQDIESSILKEINITAGDRIDSSDIYIEGLTGDKSSYTINTNKSSEQFQSFNYQTVSMSQLPKAVTGGGIGVINTDTPLKEVEIVYISSNINDQIIELNTYLDRANTKVNKEQTKVDEIDSALSNLKDLVEKKRAHIIQLPKDNKALKIKNNNTLDELQYNRSLVFGDNNVDGYKTTEITQHNILRELENQSFNTPIDIDFLNGKEGFINGSDTAYNTVFTQNLALENQITNVKNTHSVDNQLAVNLIQRKQFVQLINKILISIFIIVFLYSGFKLFKFPYFDKYTKIGIWIGIFLTIFILHSIEYILLHAVPYFSALILGTPYNPNVYWNKPGIYDYLPTVE